MFVIIAKDKDTGESSSHQYEVNNVFAAIQQCLNLDKTEFADFAEFNLSGKANAQAMVGIVAFTLKSGAKKSYALEILENPDFQDSVKSDCSCQFATEEDDF